MPKPWYRRYWLIRGKRREDTIARLVVLGILLAVVPLVIVLGSGRKERLFLPLIQIESASDPITDVLRLVNAARTQAGCEPLVIQAQLQQAASDWSLHMGQDNIFQHRDLNELRTTYGYPFSYAGENIAAAYSTAQAVFDGWMASPGHRANILNCHYRDSGIGLTHMQADDAPLQYGYYWTQNFGASGSLAPNGVSAVEQTPDALKGIIDPSYPSP